MQAIQAASQHCGHDRISQQTTATSSSSAAAAAASINIA